VCYSEGRCSSSVMWSVYRLQFTFSADDEFADSVCGVHIQLTVTESSSCSVYVYLTVVDDNW